MNRTAKRITIKEAFDEMVDAGLLVGALKLAIQQTHLERFNASACNTWLGEIKELAQDLITDTAQYKDFECDVECCAEHKDYRPLLKWLITIE